MRYLLFVFLLIVGCGETPIDLHQLEPGIYKSSISHTQNDWSLEATNITELWDISKLSDAEYVLSADDNTWSISGFEKDGVILFYKTKVESCGVASSTEIILSPSENGFVGTEKIWIGFCNLVGIATGPVLFGEHQWYGSLAN